MTPETDPRQEVETVVTPGKGVRRILPVDPVGPTEINLARERRDHALTQRHPARLGLPPVPCGVVDRAVDDDIEGLARGIGMRDPNPAPRHRDGPPPRKRAAALTAIRRFLGVNR